MNEFEKIYQTDPIREHDHAREKHPSIELSDKEYKVTTLIAEPGSIAINLKMPKIKSTKPITGKIKGHVS